MKTVTYGQKGPARPKKSMNSNTYDPFLMQQIKVKSLKSLRNKNDNPLFLKEKKMHFFDSTP
jgi:hypothetical protein